MNLLHQRGRKHFLLCKGGKILTNQVGNGGYAALSEQLFQFGNIQRILRCVVGTELVSFQNQFAAAGNVLAVALLHGFALGGCGVPGNAVGHIAGYFAPQAAAAKLDQAAAALGYNIRRQAAVQPGQAEVHILPQKVEYMGGGILTQKFRGEVTERIAEQFRFPAGIVSRLRSGDQYHVDGLEGIHRKAQVLEALV